MAATKVRNEAEKEQVLAYVAKLDRRGWTQWDIAAALKEDMGLEVSQPMVHLYVKQSRQRYKDAVIRENKERVTEALESLRDIRAEAWRGWLKSWKDADKLVEEWGTDREAVGEGDYVTSEVLLKQIKTREGRLPENAYLKTVLDTVEQERKLLGLDEVKADSIKLEMVLALVDSFQRAALEVFADAIQRDPALAQRFVQRAQQLAPVPVGITNKVEVVS